MCDLVKHLIKSILHILDGFFFLDQKKKNSFTALTMKLVVLSCIAVLFIATPLVLCQPIHEQDKKIWVWPRPEELAFGSESLWVDEFKFTIKAARNSSSSKILQKAIARTTESIKNNRIV